MLNISDILSYYIEITFSDIAKKQLYTALSLAEMFGSKFYEDKLVDIISTESLVSETRQDLVYFSIQDIPKSIILEHNIKLDPDSNYTLDELNEIANFLFIIQSLEDYTYVDYRIHALDTPKNILISLIELYSLLSSHRLQEVIEDVSEGLLIAIQALIKDRDTSESIDAKCLANYHLFNKFIEKHECLGSTLFNQGYTNQSIDDLFRLSTMDISNYIEKQLTTNFPQACLDILSLLIICKDTYELPLLALKKYLPHFNNKLENIYRIESTISKIVQDFTTFKEQALKGMEQING